MSARKVKITTLEECDRQLDRIEDKELNAVRYRKGQKALTQLAKLRERVIERRLELQHGDLFAEKGGRP